MIENFVTRLRRLQDDHKKLIERINNKEALDNGIFSRYENPVLMAAHTPLEWRYDLDPATNPYLMERFGINSVFNAGAIKFKDKYVLMARVEGNDRKSFFAIAESENGIDHFHFHDYPVEIPSSDKEETNIYDMRLVRHEDGWIYGTFCSERRDPSAPESNQSAAVAQCGIVRTRDLVTWERVPDLKTPSPQQRNVVLHPEFVNGRYAFYTRPQDSFIEPGAGGGIAIGFCNDITHAVIKKEKVIDRKKYHTVYEAKNGLGPPPIKTTEGWLHLAHGVRHTAAGLRYVLYMFMTDLEDITKVIYKPGGYFMAPTGQERVGDVPNVLFSNGWIADDNGNVFIYYASSDFAMHVATTTVDQLIDYVMNTPADGSTSYTSLRVVKYIAAKNYEFTMRLLSLNR